ncbi:hypothetical protein [uncultured Halomonas sp.]|uniref:hypothetical protein n=1 Tax=uncultured Halomonas sp. TaxID=173971 RepID=UPI002616C249|nr:hypothetical protein [uncultured Halomonas sp.]
MAQVDKKKGVWIAQVKGQTIIENTEMKALRVAVAGGGTVEFVEFGNAIGAQPEATPAPEPAQAANPTDF